MNEITELQTYFYYLQGYLVVENVLDANEVAVLRALIDEGTCPPYRQATA